MRSSGILFELKLAYASSRQRHLTEWPHHALRRPLGILLAVAAVKHWRQHFSVGCEPLHQCRLRSLAVMETEEAQRTAVY